MFGLFGALFHRLRSGPLGSELRKLLRRGGPLALPAKIALQGAIDRRFPRTFNLEPTSHCNLACVMCPRERPNKKNGFMDWELFRKIIDETRAHGPRSLTLHKDGEPLMHKRIVEMVDYIKRVNPRHNVYMSTNGLILREDHARGFIRAGLDHLHVSIGAVNPDTYRKVRGGDLDDLERRVLMLLDVKRAERAARPRVSVQIIRMPETYDEVAVFEQRWRARGVHVTVEELRHWAGGIEARADERPAVRGAAHARGAARPRHPCHALWFAPSVNWDGQVSFCCFDWDAQGVIGDLRTQTMADIWQGAVLAWHRQKHLHGEYNFPECARCDHYLDYPDLFFSRQKRAPRPGWEADDRPPDFGLRASGFGLQTRKAPVDHEAWSLKPGA